MRINLNELAKKIYQQNVEMGWWDDPNRCVYQCLQLVSTEVAEATEGERKNLMDDHLPHRRMAEVELADALIRVLDLGGRFGWEYEKLIGEVFSELTFYGSESIGARHLTINDMVINLAEGINTATDTGDLSYRYSLLIDTIIQVAEMSNYDLGAAMLEKLEYNRKRADHQRENRAKENGKKF